MTLEREELDQIKSLFADWLTEYIEKNKSMPDSGSASKCCQVTEIIIRCGSPEAVQFIGSPCVIPGKVCPPSGIPAFSELDETHQEMLKMMAKEKDTDLGALFDQVKLNVGKKLIYSELDDMLSLKGDTRVKHGDIPSISDEEK